MDNYKEACCFLCGFSAHSHAKKILSTCSPLVWLIKFKHTILFVFARQMHKEMSQCCCTPVPHLRAVLRAGTGWYSIASRLWTPSVTCTREPVHSDQKIIYIHFESMFERFLVPWTWVYNGNPNCENAKLLHFLQNWVWSHRKPAPHLSCILNCCGSVSHTTKMVKDQKTSLQCFLATTAQSILE